MSTTPLPPLPDLGSGIYKHTTLGDLYDRLQVEQRMVAYATQARADLEAENQRLREALRIAHDHIDMNALRVSHCKDAATITTALEKQP